MSTKKKEFDITYKVLVVGESTVGKTSLIRMFSRPDEALPASLLTTIGIDFVNIIKSIDNIRIRLQIWDTAGQERFRTFTKLHFRGTKGLILMYDITNEETFDRLTSWLRDIESLANEFGHKFFETSAKDNINVEKVFQELATNMKDANNPYFVPVIADPRFSLDVAKIDVVNSSQRLRVVKDDNEEIEASTSHSYFGQFGHCCGS